MVSTADGTVAELPVPAEELGRVHFIGIGGAGMSGIARIMLARGLPVSGSDAKDSVTLAALRALGATVHVGHAAANVGDADTVVVSTAIREANPELVEARRRGLRVLHRAGALASVMVGRRAVAVAGTHGKTTTTSMLTVALQHCGADPSFAIGGNLNESGANAHNGSGDVFVAEADESDGSFLLYSPTAAVVTNVEPDHLDHYGTAEAVEKAFDAFARRVEPGGFLVACADDPGAVRLAESARERRRRRPHLRRRPDADLRMVDLVDPRPRQLVRGGAARAAGSAGSSCGCPAGTTRSTPPRRWRSASGWASRSSGCARGWRASPAPGGGSSSRAPSAGSGSSTTTPTTRPSWPPTWWRPARSSSGGRVVVVFQPHLYSRTQALRRRVRDRARPGRRGRRDGRLRRPRGPGARRHRRAGRRRRAAARRRRWSSSRPGRPSPATWPSGPGPATSC